MASFRAVYLLDEIDSIAGARGQARQAADTEMNRVVCALLQMLDSRNETDSLVIGATNHPEVLDRAIMRRFEVVLRYPKPNEQMITAAIENKVRKFYGDAFTFGPVAANISEVSIARLVALAELEIKRGVMQFDIGFNLNKFWESVEREVDRGRRL